MAFHGFLGKDQSNKKRDLLPLFTQHDFMFSEKKKKSELDQDLEFKKINADRVACDAG